MVGCLRRTSKKLQHNWWNTIDNYIILIQIHASVNRRRNSAVFPVVVLKPTYRSHTATDPPKNPFHSQYLHSWSEQIRIAFKSYRDQGFHYKFKNPVYCKMEKKDRECSFNKHLFVATLDILTSLTHFTLIYCIFSLL